MDGLSHSGSVFKFWLTAVALWGCSSPKRVEALHLSSLHRLYLIFIGPYVGFVGCTKIYPILGCFLKEEEQKKLYFSVFVVFSHQKVFSQFCSVQMRIPTTWTCPPVRTGTSRPSQVP